jgi:hypothetical protein
LIFLAAVTVDEVLNLTSKLKGKFSVSYEEIQEKQVKESIQFIIKPLKFIFNLSLCSGTFPNLMKVTKVWPIHKEGTKHEISIFIVGICILLRVLSMTITPISITNNINNT